MSVTLEDEAAGRDESVTVQAKSGVKNHCTEGERGKKAVSLPLYNGLAVISFESGNAGVALFDPCVSSNQRGAEIKSFWKSEKPFFKKVFAVFFELASTKKQVREGSICR